MIRLDKVGFRRWLSKNEGKIVGPIESRSSCPMCRYLKSEGAKKVLMSINYRYVDGKIYDHRGWQRTFQIKAMSFQNVNGFNALRGGEAIDILDSV